MVRHFRRKRISPVVGFVPQTAVQRDRKRRRALHVVQGHTLLPQPRSPSNPSLRSLKRAILKQRLVGRPPSRRQGESILAILWKGPAWSPG